MNVFRVSAAAIICLAGLAGADVPSFNRPWMPDIDQYRFLGGGTLGLPNDGRMYCVPTATLNLMAYLDRHGYPAMLDLAENESFYTTNAYIELGTDLIFMGILMGTDPFDGTGEQAWLDGTRGWIGQRYDAWKFVVVQKGSSQFDPVGPQDFSAYHAMGCIMTMSIGWYDFLGNDTYLRDGGHVVTAVSVSDPPDGPPVIGCATRPIPTKTPLPRISSARRHHPRSSNCTCFARTARPRFAC